MANIPKAICDCCAHEFKAYRNGVVIEMMMGESDAGYYKIRADEYRCICPIIIYFPASQPLSIQHETGYRDIEAEFQGRF